MGQTDRQFRNLVDLMAPDLKHNTPMIHADAIVYASEKFLHQENDNRKAVGIQIAGNDPSIMTDAAKIISKYNYNEINLNIGCPSLRVQSCNAGVALMQDPCLVANCVRAIRDKVDLPLSIKTRIGIDDKDDYNFLSDFVAETSDAGCRVFIIHARKAFLQGLNPKQNRTIPPIDYDKTINYTKYYWLQTGPDRCDITDPIIISDIVGKKTYTYTSLDNTKTLKFTTGLKVRFTGTVTPSTQANIDYIVADVGTSIRLIPLSELYTPESAVYTLSKDYLTIKRGSIDGNQWSNNNRWFHEEVITATATYNETVAEYDSAVRAKRPILEFDNDLKLYDYGTKLLTTVDLVDSTFTDAFTELEGKGSSSSYICLLYTSDAADE